MAVLLCEGAFYATDAKPRRTWVAKCMADVAQLVRAPVCGTGGCGFDPRHSPHFLFLFEPVARIKMKIMGVLASIGGLSADRNDA